jgi:hypothetical protein
MAEVTGVVALSAMSGMAGAERVWSGQDELAA